MKIVEKTGDKVVNLIQRSDSWSDQDCDRADYILCTSAGEEDRRCKCRKRNVVHETYCLTCFKKEREEEKRKQKLEK